MHTVLIYTGGRQVDALLLSASPERMRVVIPGRGDALEYRMVDGSWTNDAGVRVEIGALMIDDRIGVPQYVPQTKGFAASAV